MNFNIDCAIDNIYSIIKNKKEIDFLNKKAFDIYNSISNDTSLRDLYKKVNQLKQIKTKINSLTNNKNIFNNNNDKVNDDDEVNDDDINNDENNNNEESNEENDDIIKKIFFIHKISDKEKENKDDNIAISINGEPFQPKQKK